MSYYICKIEISSDESNKVHRAQILVESTGVIEAETKVNEHLADTMGTYEVTSVSKTAIESVLKQTD